MVYGRATWRCGSALIKLVIDLYQQKKAIENIY